MSKLYKNRRAIYIRDPNKNYAFVKIGEFAYWEKYGKAIFIDDVLYELKEAKK